MPPLSIRDFKQELGPAPAPATVHVQLEAALQKTTKTGNPYYEMRFVDGQDTLVIREWNDGAMFATCGQLRAGQFFTVSGEFSLGRDGKSVDPKRWEARPLEESDIEALLAGPGDLQRKQEEDYRFIENTIAAVADPRLRTLGQAFLAQYGERFRRTGAARGYHHARRGGLVEHVAQMMRSAVKICEAYEMLNRDLLVCGVLFHDIGKLWENAYAKKGFTMPYTEISELISHIPLGMEIVNQLWRGLVDSPEAEEWKTLEPDNNRVRLHLLHLIASHHGELQFGAPVEPKTPEAQALHYIDNLDAKLEMFQQGYLTSPELGKNVHDYVRPLGRMVTPLPAFSDGAEEKTQDGAPDEPSPDGKVEKEPF